MKTTAAMCAFCLASVVSLSAHAVRGLASPEATAFVSSPSAGSDAPIKITWGDPTAGDTGLRVVCFYVANTSAPRAGRPEWPRITGIGMELPGSSAGFALLGPLNGDWELVENATADLFGYGTATLDFAILAGVNPTGRTPGQPDDPRGIAPGQAAARGSGTRFCVSGPFPDRLPNLATADPQDTVATTIEGLLNGIVVGFQGVAGTAHGRDTGVWFPTLPGGTGPGPDPRMIPLYP